MSHHIVWHPTIPGVIEAILCPICAVPVRKLMKSETLLESRQVSNVVIETYLATMATFPNYAEYDIEMEDGTVHVMPICKSCRDKVTPGQEREMLTHSQAVMLEESERTGTKPPPIGQFARKTRKEKLVEVRPGP